MPLPWLFVFFMIFLFFFIVFLYFSYSFVVSSFCGVKSIKMSSVEMPW